MKQSRFFKSFSWLLIFCLYFSLFMATPVKAQSLIASPSKIEIGPNKKITVTFSEAPGDDNDSIGLYKVGETKILANQRLEGKTSGTLEFDAPQTPGSYEFQLWKNDWRMLQENKLATSNPFIVKWPPVGMKVSIGSPDAQGKRNLSIQYSGAPGLVL